MLALAIEFIRVHLIARNSVSRFGGYSGGETPGPIPNPEVKPSSADGTALETGWESRSSPRLLRRRDRLRAVLSRLSTLAHMRPPHGSRRAGPLRTEFDLPRAVVGEIRQTAKPGRAEEAARHAEKAVELLGDGDATGAAREAVRAK